MQALLTKQDLAKFPFTTEASDYIKSFNIKPVELARPELNQILERAMERIKQAVFSGRISGELTQDDVDILAYPTALMLISTLADDRALGDMLSQREREHTNYYEMKPRTSSFRLREDHSLGMRSLSTEM